MMGDKSSMKANKKTLMAIKKFLNEEQEFWDIDEFKSELVAKTNILKHKSMEEHNLSPDECGIEWGGEEVCNLQNFIDEYTNKFIEGICNVLDSFVGEDISCYFDEEI
jgi:hypothetical protein